MNDPDELEQEIRGLLIRVLSKSRGKMKWPMPTTSPIGNVAFGMLP